MSRWPWIATIVAGLATFNPIGFALIQQALLSGERLARNIALPLVLAALAILLLLGLLEWGIRVLILRRRARAAPDGATDGDRFG